MFSYSRVRGVFAALFLVASGAPVAAQGLSRPITIVVPYAVGGSTDVIARSLAEVMTRDLKTQVLIENVGGAGGTIGSARVAKAAPDGQTLLLHNMGHAASRALYKGLSYDPATSFEPIGMVADVPMILVGRPDFPIKDARELFAKLKSLGSQVKFAQAGNGSTSHLCATQLATALGAEPSLIPYRGTGPALQDLLGKQVDLLCDQPVATGVHIKSGALKAYALLSKTRAPTLPDVPTSSESGLAGVELTVWHGLYAPRGTPQAAVERISAALQRALRDPALVQRYAQLAAVPPDATRMSPQALQSHLRSEMDRWGELIRKAGISAD